MPVSNQLPVGWAECVIGDVVASDGVFKDGDWVESKDQDPSGDVRLIQLADIGEARFIDKSDRFLTSKKARELNCTFLKPGDILLARMPDPLGRCCIFPLKDDHFYVTVVDVCVIRFGDSSVSNRFMMHLINSPSIRRKISALQSGSTRKRISRGNLATIPLPLPPVNEQHRIVAKIETLFSELDKGIEALKTAREQLKVYRQAVLKHAFEGKLTAHWREQNKDKLESPEQLLARIQQEREARYQQQRQDWKADVKLWESNGKDGKKPRKPASTKSLESYATSELAQMHPLPDSWIWLPFGLLDVDLKRGPFGSAITKSMFVADGFKVYQQGNAIYKDANRGHYFIDQSKYKELIGFSVAAGDFLVSCSGTVGRIFLVPEGAPEGVINQALMRVRVNETVLDKRFFELLFSSEMFQRKVLSDAKGSAMVNLAGVKELNLVPVAICGLAEQKQICELLDSKLSSLDKLEEAIEVELDKSETLRQSILNKAFSGQLVPQDPNDKPADVLLERIRAEKAAKVSSKPATRKKSRSKAQRTA